MKKLERGTVVLLTRNHRVRLLRTLRFLQELPESWPVIVVDNGSTDGTAKAVGRQFPGVMLIRSRRNIGVAARNIAVAYAHTPYIAFANDDSRWEPGALERAANVLDANDSVGVVSACVKDPASGSPDAASQALAVRSMGSEGLSGSRVFGFNPNACVFRTRAFYEAGGVWPPLFEDGEELLLAIDFAERGWQMIYRDDVVIWHAGVPASARASARRLRNTIWTAWMRLPVRQAWNETMARLHEAAGGRQLRPVLLSSMFGGLKALKRRQVVSRRVAALWAGRYQHACGSTEEIRPAPSRQSMV